jgi:hypothetical protein
LIGRGFHQALADRTACVRDENLYRPELLPHSAEPCRDLFCVGYVSTDCQRIRSQLGGEFAN